MNRSQQVSVFVAAALLWTVACGCGPGDSSAPVATNPAPASAPAPPQLIPQPAPQVRPVRPPARRGRSPSGKSSREELSGGPTSQDFVIDDEHAPFVLERPRGASLRDQFVAFTPSSGAVPNGFEVVPPDVPDGDGPGAATNSPPPGVDVLFPEGFTVISTERVGPNQMPSRIRCDWDGSEMVYVPAGVFIQGTNGGPSDCGPAHPAYVSGFYIDVTEVTLGQFAAFQQRQRERRRGTLNEPLNVGESANRPALGISWRDAELYAAQLGKALPTEAEWEKAARGPSSFEFPWGNGRVAWHAPRTPGQIDAVKSFPADQSRYGVFDLAGNAREWCSDWYASDYYAQARERDGSAIRDPKGPSRAEIVGHHVVKGGRTGWRLWHRDHALMREPIADVGFRCVLRVAPGLAASGRTTEEPAEAPPSTLPAPREGNGF